MLGFPSFDERRLVEDVEESDAPNPEVPDSSSLPETTTIAIRPPSSLLHFARRMGLNATLKELEALTAHAQVRRGMHRVGAALCASATQGDPPFLPPCFARQLTGLV